MNLPWKSTEAPRELRIVEPVDHGGYFAEPQYGAEMWQWPTPAAPQPPTRRTVPWKPIAIAAMPVGGLLAYLIYLNAALFAVVTALTIIGVCSAGDKIKRHCSDDH